MTEKQIAASQWRIDLTRRLMTSYNHPGIKMIVLGGSSTRNLSDEFSDLDIVVYWDSIDASFIDGVPLKARGIDRYHIMKMPGGDSQLETYYVDNLKVDVSHITLSFWEEVTRDVMEKADPTGWKLKTISGFSESIHIMGDEVIKEWKARLEPYPDDLMINVIKSNRRLYVQDCLLNQGLARDEMLFVYDGICNTLKGMINILGALNRIFVSMDEPRWVEFELERMTIKPPDLWLRIKSILEAGDSEAIASLDKIISEVMALVKEHCPDPKIGNVERVYEMAVKPCIECPYL